MKNLLSNPEQSAPRKGPGLLQCLVLVLFCLFAVRLWYLQIHLGPVFTEKSRNNQLRTEYIFASRGFLRDRNGELLAVNEPAFALGLVREDCDDIPATLAQVSQWSGIPLERLKEVYARNKPKVKSFEPLTLVPDMDFDLIAKVEGSNVRWPGLEIIARTRRKYNYGQLLAHILGYVGEANEPEMQADSSLALGDLIGKQGLEKNLDARLRGTKGIRLIEVDATGRRLSEQLQRKPKTGEEISLSLDLSLQQLGHKELEGKAGAVVVMDADTGEVYAMVSEPSYDSNAFTSGLSAAQWAQLRDDPMHPLENRAIQGVYPPGSVFKLVMAATALSENAVNPDETFFCPGYITLGNHMFRDWKKGGHGTVNLRKALVESCDVYFYKVAARLGVDRISAYAKAAGFGSRTGIDLPNERSGLVPSRQWKMKRFHRRWTKGEDLNLGIGQGYTGVTPIQVARFVASLVNGGKLLKPLLLRGQNPVVEARLPLSPKNAEIIRNDMIATVDDPHGTCHRILTPGVVVGGKTGSAQVVHYTEEMRRLGGGIPYKYRDHAWMAGFAERGNRRFVIVALVEHGMHGASGAGPVVKAMIDALFMGKKELPPKDTSGVEGPASPAARLNAVEPHFPDSAQTEAQGDQGKTPEEPAKPEDKPEPDPAALPAQPPTPEGQEAPQ